MKEKCFLLLMFAGAISTGCSSLQPSVAQNPALLGDPAPAPVATRTVHITPDTKYVNINGGEIVNFIAGDKSFAWSFNASQYPSAFDLKAIAPSGWVSQPIVAYIAPNPINLGSGFAEQVGSAGR